MAARGPEDLSISEMLTMSRDIIDQITASEALLQTVGILRLAGAHGETMQMIEEGKTRQVTAQNLHTHIDVLKKILPQLRTKLETLDPDNIKTIQRLFQDTLDESTETQLSAKQALNDYIHRLAMSGNKEKEQIAEILYSFLHLGTHVLAHESVNKINENNVGILTGPMMAQALGLVGDDPMLLLSAQTNVNAVLSAVVSAGSYAAPFFINYGQQLYERRQQAMQQATEQAEKTGASLGKLTALIRDIHNEIRMTNRNIESLKAQKQSVPHGLLHKKTEAERAFVKRTNAQLEVEKSNLKSLEARLEGVNKQIALFGEQRMSLLKETTHLRNSMAFIEARSRSASPVSSDQDSDLSSHDISSDTSSAEGSPRAVRSFLPSGSSVSGSSSSGASASSSSAASNQSEQQLSDSDIESEDELKDKKPLRSSKS